MDTSKLVPNDPRVEHATAQIRGKTYKYILGKPKGEPIATIVLVHGFPDMGFGWRYQVPYFMSLGFQVVVPDMLGYSGTDAPQELGEYSLKSLSDDIKELAIKFVGEGQIILGGHDWGGALVWRVALWHPELIRGVFSICTPFNAPVTTYTSLEDLVGSGKVPTFGYQLQFKGPEVEKNIQGAEKVHQFLNTMYGGRGKNGEAGMTAKSGILFDNIADLGPSPLVSKEELAYYVESYMAQKEPQLRGPLNWYRTREINYEEELTLTRQGKGVVQPPALFIAATRDIALPPSMSVGMERNFKNLSRGEVEANHWALWEASDAVNERVSRWLNELLGGAIKSSL